MKTTVADCTLLELPRVYNVRGSLTAINNHEQIPFAIQRTYHLYDVPGGAERGGHAHRHLQQLLVSVMGAFDVILDDGQDKSIVRLDRAYMGLYIPTLIWRELINFSSGGICLVLASEPYDENEYIRDYPTFRSLKDDDYPVSRPGIEPWSPARRTVRRSPARH